MLGSVAIIGMFFTSELVGFFREDPSVVSIGSAALLAQFMALFFQPLSVCANMMFQSVGKNGIATFLSMLRSGLYFIPVLLVLSASMGLVGIEIAQTVADAMAFLTVIPFTVPFMRKLKEKENYAMHTDPSIL